MPDTKKSTKRSAKRDESPGEWTEEERAAMQEHAKQLKSEKRRGGTSREEGEADLLAKIAEMSDADRAIAERIHAIVQANAPELTPRTYYGMPAYARDGKTVCFFQPSGKFKSRYSTIGFEQAANLDEGSMWPTAWALTELTKADETKIAELVKKAAS